MNFLSKKGTKRRILSFSMAAITTVMLLSGCQAPLKNAYDDSTRLTALAENFSESDFYADGFASDLCVVSDEKAYDADFATSEAAALFSLDDRQVMYSKEAFKRMYPASITKIMTALIAIKYGDLSETVTVPQEAVITETGASLCGIRPGDTLTLEQLLYGLMLPSGNDAGAAIAVHMEGSIEAFADKMNQEAARLGATKTHFVNPHGLSDPEHYTTAYDLYLILNEALKYPAFRTIAGCKAYSASYHDKDGSSVSKTWKNGNWYLTGEKELPEGLSVVSGKTGTTQDAGYCLIMAEKDVSDKEYISVVLKADSRPHLYDNMSNIISKIVK